MSKGKEQRGIPFPRFESTQGIMKNASTPKLGKFGLQIIVGAYHFEFAIEGGHGPIAIVSMGQSSTPGTIAAQSNLLEGFKVGTSGIIIGIIGIEKSLITTGVGIQMRNFLLHVLVQVLGGFGNEDSGIDQFGMSHYSTKGTTEKEFVDVVQQDGVGVEVDDTVVIGECEEFEFGVDTVESFGEVVVGIFGGLDASNDPTVLLQPLFHLESDLGSDEDHVVNVGAVAVSSVAKRLSQGSDPECKVVVVEQSHIGVVLVGGEING
jgi:hypothetical protein